MADYSKKVSLEEKLLLSLCRLQFTNDQKKQISEYLKEKIDWNYLIKIANEHGIIALCWNNFAERENGFEIPPEYLNKLYSGFIISLVKNTHLSDLLKNVLSLAKEENIKIVLLKGLALERSIYGNRGIRQMNDLDILVNQRSAIKLRKKLIKNGFETTPIISPLHEINMPSYGKHLPEMYKNGISVEIHFKLFDQEGDSLTKEFIDSAVLSTYDSKNSEVFLPEQQLFFLYLVKHLDKHENSGTSQLRLYTDLFIYLLNFQDKILNFRLFEIAEIAGISNALTEKFYILKVFWNFHYPSWIEERFIIIDSDKISETFIQFLHQPNNQKEEIQESLLKPISDISGFTNKILFILGCTIPSIAYMKFRYKTTSPLFTLLYYPVRCVKLIKRLFLGQL